MIVLNNAEWINSYQVINGNNDAVSDAYNEVVNDVVR